MLDNRGKPAAGDKVTFNINGVFYTRTADEKGFATLNINLPPGDYIITATYKGCSVSNNIKVITTLIGQNITMAHGVQGQFKVILLNGLGQRYPDQKVSFNINGVLYTRTTDAEGAAFLNINLPSGRYIITSTYDGLSISNTVAVI